MNTETAKMSYVTLCKRQGFVTIMSITLVEVEIQQKLIDRAATSLRLKPESLKNFVQKGIIKISIEQTSTKIQ